MSADLDLLCRAITAMRERAEAATPGLAEWWVNGDAAKWLHSATRTQSLVEYIPSWHPAVALAVADWLESVANAARSEINGADIHHALAVARAYLGESA